MLIIAGPCVIESEDHVMFMAEKLQRIIDKHKAALVFKASFDKANRSSGDSYRGPGIWEGMRILGRVREELCIRVTSDVHSVGQVDVSQNVLDIIQIPAFLCRQTDLLKAAALTRKPVNVKKGQFMAPMQMLDVVRKLKDEGNEAVMVTERGTTFGYNNLVVDMRSLEIMRGLGVQVVFDATHSVQLPGDGDGRSGGDSRFVAPLARAAVAVGVDALFMEVHDDPESALCDGPNMITPMQLDNLLPRLLEIEAATS
jgi:2-dehydro-3-deoxyphosphooctonate aldolase (KDO 8-P synthase)